MTSQSSLHMLSLRPFISDLLELVMNDHCNMSTLLSLTAWQVSLGTGDIAHVDGVKKVGQIIKGDESSNSALFAQGSQLLFGPMKKKLGRDV